jgi:hypothetical protein
MTSPFRFSFGIAVCFLIVADSVAQDLPASLGNAVIDTDDDSSTVAPQFAPSSTTVLREDSEPAAFDSVPRFEPSTQDALPTESPPKASQSIEVHYTIQLPVTETVRRPDGKVSQITRYVVQTRAARFDIEADLKKLDIPPEGKRAAVLAVTAARHPGLLEKLKAAKTPEEKESCSKALKENYTEHYAIETWWREEKLAQLEARLSVLREQVSQRQDSEEKYVAAAMTIAELWADGIGITPPTPSRLPNASPTVLPQAYSPVYGNGRPIGPYGPTGPFTNSQPIPAGEFIPGPLSKPKRPVRQPSPPTLKSSP